MPYTLLFSPLSHCLSSLGEEREFWKLRNWMLGIIQYWTQQSTPPLLNESNFHDWGSNCESKLLYTLPSYSRERSESTHPLRSFALSQQHSMPLCNWVRQCIAATQVFFKILSHVCKHGWHPREPTAAGHPICFFLQPDCFPHLHPQLKVSSQEKTIQFT